MNKPKYLIFDTANTLKASVIFPVNCSDVLKMVHR